jgi:hypothetical protein
MAMDGAYIPVVEETRAFGPLIMVAPSIGYVWRDFGSLANTPSRAPSFNKCCRKFLQMRPLGSIMTTSLTVLGHMTGIGVSMGSSTARCLWTKTLAAKGFSLVIM